MLASGNFLELRSGGAVYVYDTFANAPLQYWARAGVASVLGKSMLSMRILSALSALLAVLVTYRLVLYLGGRRAGLAAGIVLITSFQFLYLHSARTGELEPTVCLLLVSCALLFIRTIDEPSRHWWPHHLLLAVLFNLKAPIVVIPGLPN
jgi:4-amino-4-deoxy-L-arabinose transferase-like glycosyltransferase